MQIKQGTDVYTADDKKVGHVERVVMNPKVNEVTHLVVEKGFLFTKDRVLPMDMIGQTEKDKIILKPGYSKNDFDDLPEFEETYYIPAEEVDHAENEPVVGHPNVNDGDAYPYYYYGAYGYGTAAAWQFAPPFWATPDYMSYEAKNIPADTVALKPGMDIYTLDEEEVGSLDDIVVDADHDRISYFTISKGLIFQKTKAIPVHWIDYIHDDHIHLSVTKHTIKNLPDYEAEPA